MELLLHQVSDRWCHTVMLCWISKRLPTATLGKLPISQLVKEDKEALEGGDILSFEPMGKLQYFCGEGGDPRKKGTSFLSLTLRKFMSTQDCTVGFD